MSIETRFLRTVQLLSLLIIFCRLLFNSLVGVGVRGGFLSPVATMASDECRQANGNVRKSLAIAKYMMASEDNTIVDQGFHRDLELSLLGIKLPFTISMNASNGALTSYETIVRSKNATECVSSSANTLDGEFTYQKDIRLSYATMSAKLLLWMTNGSLTYILQPNIFLSVSKAAEVCKLEKFNLKSLGNTAYEVTTGSSWASRLVGKAVKFALNQQDSTQMLNVVMNHLQDNVNSFFVPAWCDLINTV